MKLPRSIFAVWIGMVSVLSAQANGIITIQGKLTSITETLYIVETQAAIYQIARNQVSKPDQEKIERPEVQSVKYTKPFEVSRLKKPPARQ